ncbi:hypothetical protein OPT61_g9780 [Boeremia exigua]|uniref:Uncharacterized protein n=1 Tax=Boeremia exigua TaxID=749465 RepID=A0ACC2HSM5_9PLEO|nr:hypothetical protein OPT61_g9780 [Boeremia exigua]
MGSSDFERGRHGLLRRDAGGWSILIKLTTHDRTTAAGQAERAQGRDKKAYTAPDVRRRAAKLAATPSVPHRDALKSSKTAKTIIGRGRVQ